MIDAAPFGFSWPPRPAGSIERAIEPAVIDRAIRNVQQVVQGRRRIPRVVITHGTVFAGVATRVWLMALPDWRSPSRR